MAPVVLAMVVLLTSASLAPAQGQSDPRALELLRDWVTAVRSHTPGVYDNAVAAIAAWDREDLLRARPYVRAWVDVLGATWRTRRMTGTSLPAGDAASIRSMATAPDQAGANDFIKRAALLHTDVVLLSQLVPGSVPPPKPLSQQSRFEREEQRPLVIARGPDGRFESFEFGNLNWDYARDLLDAVTPGPSTDETVALWYRAVGAVFASTYSFGEAMPHVQRARRLLPDDPGILFGDGAIQETLASPRIQDYVRVTTLPEGQRFLFVKSANDHLEDAEALFRRALQRDPGLVEARVRLGRVLSQRGRHQVALTELQAVPPQSDTVLTYFTHLLRGDTERALSQFEAAERSYKQALALFPSAQSARLALGHLARLRSDRKGALALLTPSLSMAPEDRDDDPWWSYHHGDGRNVTALFRRLRAPFLEAAPQ